MSPVILKQVEVWSRIQSGLPRRGYPEWRNTDPGQAFLVMPRRNRAHTVEDTARHIRAAQELVDRQRTLIAKFEREGLDVTSERYLLDSLQNVLTTDEARMGRLVYEDGLGCQDKKKRSRQ